MDTLPQAEGTAPEAPIVAAPAPASRRENLPATMQSLATTVVIALFVITFLVQAFQIPSESMENTLLVGDYVLVDKVRFAPAGNWRWLLPYDRITRGDVIVFKYPVHPDEHFVKRVAAIPGDRIRMVAGHAVVNGKPLQDSYALFKHREDGETEFRDSFPNGLRLSSQADQEWLKEFPALTRGGELVVPEDHFFVLGDNRNESLDSRYWGFVARKNIVGDPRLIYFSLVQPARNVELRGPNDKIDGFTAWMSRFSVRWRRTFRFIH